MKKKCIYIAVLFPILMMAQAGINTTSPQAKLDVMSSSKGILVPRLALFSRGVAAPVTSPNEGELVFNTHTTLDSEGIDADKRVKKGFYYWANGKWNRWGDDKKVPGFSLQYDTNGYLLRPDKDDGNSVGEWENLTWDDGNPGGTQAIQFVAPNNGTYQIILAAKYGIGHVKKTSHAYNFAIGEGVYRIEIKINGTVVENVDKSVNALTIESPSKFDGLEQTFYDLPKHINMIKNISMNEGDVCCLTVMFDEIRLENVDSGSKGDSWIGDTSSSEYNSSIQIQFVGQ